MSELQTETESAPNDIITQEAAPTESGTVENGPDLATGGDENPDKINQDSVNDSIKRATHLRHKAERATKASDKRADDLQDQLNAIEAAKEAPVISDLPDQYDVTDDEYRAALLRRDDQIRAQAAHTNAAQARQNAVVQRQNDALADQQRELEKSGIAYRDRMQALKVTEEQLKTAVSVIDDYGMSGEVAQYIMNDPNGPLITTYLGKNPDLLHEMSQMTPMQAAVMITQKISPKFASTKPVNSQAPAPLDRIKGSGTAPRKRGATGTTFE